MSFFGGRVCLVVPRGVFLSFFGGTDWWEGLFGGPLGCIFGGSIWGSSGICWGVPHGG